MTLVDKRWESRRFTERMHKVDNCPTEGHFYPLPQHFHSGLERANEPVLLDGANLYSCLADHKYTPVWQSSLAVKLLRLAPNLPKTN